MARWRWKTCDDECTFKHKNGTLLTVKRRGAVIGSEALKGANRYRAYHNAHAAVCAFGIIKTGGAHGWYTLKKILEPPIEPPKRIKAEQILAFLLREHDSKEREKVFREFMVFYHNPPENKGILRLRDEIKALNKELQEE